MTKQLTVNLRRHMHSYRDPLGIKHDGPSLKGLEEARAVGEELKANIPDGGVAFYTSTMYRTQIAADVIAATAGLEPMHTPTSALDPMKRSKAYEAAMKSATEGIEDRIVAYCLTPENMDPNDRETETPAGYAERLAMHITNIAKHFEGLQDGQARRIENISHEPGLTAVVMHILGMNTYDEEVFHGAAKTAEAVQFRMESNGKSSLVAVTMEYRNQSYRGTVRM